MPNVNDMVKLAVDNFHGNVEKYSLAESNKVLRDAIVELNGGSTKLDYRRVRDGQCGLLFSFIEETLKRTVNEGLQENDFYNTMVEYRNIAAGDEQKFVIEDSQILTVADLADGTQAVRRQRLNGSHEITVPTHVQTVKIFEEMNRVMSGRVDFNEMIRKVSEAFAQKRLNDIYTLWTSVTADQIGGVTYFPIAGAYDADALLDVISHVEAASGKVATIVGTKKALRVLKNDLTSNSEKEDIYNMGYVGKFYGTPVIAEPQRHKIGTTEFILNDKVLTIVATDEKPIKVVEEGSPLIVAGNFTDNVDLTQEYLVARTEGMALVLAGGNSGIGRYEFN